MAGKKNNSSPKRKGNAKSSFEVSFGKKGNRKFSVSKQISQEAYNLKKGAQQNRALRQKQKTERVKQYTQDNKYIGAGKGFGYATTPLASSMGGSSVVKSGTEAYINRNFGAVTTRKAQYGNPDDVEEMTETPENGNYNLNRDMSRR